MGKLVVAGASSLLIINVLFLNANVLATQNPVAVNLYNATADLPPDCDVATRADGWDGFTVRYVQVNGRPDITKIDFADVDNLAITDGRRVFVLSSQVQRVDDPTTPYNELWDEVVR